MIVDKNWVAYAESATKIETGLKYNNNFTLAIILECLLNSETPDYQLSPYFSYSSEGFSSSAKKIECFIKKYSLDVKFSYFLDDEMMEIFVDKSDTYYGNAKAFGVRLNHFIECFEANILYNESILDGIWLDEDFDKYLNTFVLVTFRLKEQNKPLLENYIKSYLNNFKNNLLSGFQAYSYKEHLCSYLNFLENIEEKLNLNHVEFPVKDICKNAEYKYRFIEFLLILEEKAYLKIKNIIIDFSAEFDYWNDLIFELEILKTSGEIMHLESLKTKQVSTVDKDNKIDLNICKNSKKHPDKLFTLEELEVLRLRSIEAKPLKEIGLLMNPQLKESRVKQLSKDIRNKLGANNIDEALRLFEDKYQKL